MGDHFLYAATKVVKYSFLTILLYSIFYIFSFYISATAKYAFFIPNKIDRFYFSCKCVCANGLCDKIDSCCILKCNKNK